MARCTTRKAANHTIHRLVSWTEWANLCVLRCPGLQSHRNALNGAQQGLLDQQNQLGSSLNNLAINQTNKVSGILGSPISTDGLTPYAQTPTSPGFGNVSGARDLPAAMNRQSR
jgi:hypothetical protein